MRLLELLLFVLVGQGECISNSSDNQCVNVKNDLLSLRKRRHLTFPAKTDFVMTISLVKAFMTHAPSGWNIALEIDVLFPLPDEAVTNQFWRRKLHHKQKRELWERIQGALDVQNINGRACIVRSVCEARTESIEARIAPKGKSLVHDILRVIFTAQLHDEDFKTEMNRYHEFSNPNFCEQMATNDGCPFSILDYILALNKQHF